LKLKIPLTVSESAIIYRSLFASQAEDTQTYNTQQYTNDKNDDK